MLHKDLPITDMHRIHSWEWANAAAKTAQSVLNADEGKIGWQVDTNAFYVLVDFSVPTWLKLNLTPITVSTSAPTGGVDGDIWYEREV